MSKEYQVLFFTHTGAIKFKRIMKKEDISCELMPVPRALSSNCGVSARIYYDGQANNLVNDQVEKIFQNNNGDYALIFSSDS
ncbi:DUF3343 domain-containing protein [Herbivorax sp. ANBcel31]|uniref:DUF3343 domain-containing protein n=1 Tax=Herbivorax sp. ANBcel31 TaxID=3069754 RepID=UPI0027B62C03|nr:DUF3343 domain-containing protein [Herbivorax sp. ANBcel31]MDQ2087247.1 DUF3343 domain-containing protein [Herbivorax sp. ANBcel31]